MKKFNWGHGIFLFYVIFVIILGSAVFASTRVNHNLVVDDYYAKDLAYQNMYNKKSNHIKDKNLEIQYEQNKKIVTLDFLDNSKATGTVYFYRPSDKTKDFVKTINTEGKLLISTDGKLPGAWKVKVDWVQNGKSYFEEKEIYF